MNAAINTSVVVKILVEDSPKICDQWSMLLDELGLPESVKKEMTNANTMVTLGPKKLLDFWKDIILCYSTEFGNDATLGRLRRALRNIGNKLGSDVLEEKFPNCDNALFSPNAPLEFTANNRPTPTTSGRNDNDGASSSIPKIKKETTPIANNVPPQMDEHDFVDDMQPLNVVVKMAEEFLGDKNKDYSLRSSPRGHALIVNNIHFDDERRNRSGGAELDASYMTQLWEQLGFQCHLEKDVYDKEELTSALDKFKKKFSRKKVDCCVVIIMSHGEHDQVFLCNDSKVNLWKDIVYQFDHDRAPHLKGTPKVFIFQACQDFRTGTDSSGYGSYPIEDTIVCFPSLPGHSAHRDHHKGSWFLYVLTKVMMEEAGRLHFLEILEKIQKEEMNRIRNTQNIAQLPIWIPISFQKLFFNPGLQE